MSVIIQDSLFDYCVHVDEALGTEEMRQWEIENSTIEWLHPFLAKFETKEDVLAFRIKFGL